MEDECAICGDEGTAGMFCCSGCGRGVCEFCKDKTYSFEHCSDSCMQDDEQREYEDRQRDLSEFTAE